MVGNSSKGGQGLYSHACAPCAQKGAGILRWDEWGNVMQRLSDWTRLYANSVYLLYMRWYGSPVSACAGERPVCRRFEQVIFSGVSRDKEASLPSGEVTMEDNRRVIAVGTPVVHHHHHPRRPPSRFHRPHQTAIEMPGQRSPNPREMTMHARQLAYPPRTLPGLRSLAMVRYRFSLVVVTQRVPMERY